MKIVKIVGFSLMTSACVSLACQSFLLPHSHSMLMAKNFEYPYRHGRLFLNRKNLKKRALVRAGEKAKVWTAKYPSLTFNQVAEHFPMGGINTQGLAVEVLISFLSDFPRATKKPILSELQWIQYILDTCANLPQAIRAAKRVDIIGLSHHHLHYHACDKKGRCAVFEYRDGKLEIESPSAFAVANDRYSKSSWIHRDMEKIDLALGDEEFETAADEALAAFKIWRRQSYGGGAWQIIYELSNSRVHFRVRKDSGLFSEPLPIRTVGFWQFARDSDKDCMKAPKFEPEAVYVLPSWRFNLASSREDDSRLLSRHDFFQSVEDNFNLLKESKNAIDLLDSNIARELKNYGGTHVSCVPAY